MQKIMHGIVRGKCIELKEAHDFADGQDVVVIVKPEGPPASFRPGEGWKRLAGLLANDWTEEDDRILEQIYQSRKGNG